MFRRLTWRRVAVVAAVVALLAGCTVHTNAATNVTATSATLNGTLTFGSKDQGGQYWFEWSSDNGAHWTPGPTHLLGNQNCHYTGSGTEGNPIPIHEDISGLAPDTRYIFRIGGKVCDSAVVYADANWNGQADDDYDEFTTQLDVAKPTVTTPRPGDASARRFLLQAQAASALASATFEYRRLDGDPWLTVPLVDVYTGAGQQLQGWPTQLDQNGRTLLLTWDAWRTLGSEGLVQIRAHFYDGSGGWVASDPVKVTLSRSNSDVNDATAPVGPGTVDLMTGNFSVSSNDVSIDAPTTDLVASRTYLSRSANKNPNGPLGPGWRLGLPVPSAASAYEGLNAGALSGPRTPASVVDDASAGSVPWENPGSARALDGALAASNVHGTFSHLLRATNFGFSIPAGATIKGIKVDVAKTQDGDGAVFDSDGTYPGAGARIVKGGTIGGTDHGRWDFWPAGPPTFVPYGAEDDLWGLNWTPADINASNFGFSIGAFGYSSYGWAYVDSIRVTVFYSPPGSDGSVVLTQTDGTQAHFGRNTDGSYTAETGLPKMTLSKAGADFVLDDRNGDKTTFSSITGDRNYVPVKVEQPGTATQTTFKWSVVAGAARITQVLAPPPQGVSCDPQLNAGCRALTFDYATATTATGTASSQWGDYAGHLKTVNLVAYDPAAGQNQMRTVPVQQYSYDNGGRLRAAWDPRIAPALKTRYFYDANGLLSQLTPPGVATWNLAYTTTPDDAGLGRLKSVSRSATGLPTETTTVAYGVPLSGTSAPYPMTPAVVGTWGQLDDPTDATAIFAANHVPANPPAGFAPAVISYMNAKGQLVNLAAPGGRIATTEHDANGQITRELDPANRARALQNLDSVRRSQELDTERVYSADGLQLQKTTEPLHNVKLDNGSTVPARARTVMTYDEGSPGGYPFNLLTTKTEGAYIPSTNTLTDQRVTSYGYDTWGDSQGWIVRQPTTTTVDPGGLRITRSALYDTTTGLQLWETQPNWQGATSSGALLTVTSYYTAAGSGQCGGKPWMANLQCTRGPNAQPSSGPPVPSSAFNYNMLDLPTTKTDTSGATTRTKLVGYDTAGRITASVVSGPGATVPTVGVTYDAATGLLKNSAATIDGTPRSLVRGYDAYGRLISYKDADGVTATTTYDVLDRAVSGADGKGTQAITYDALTGDLTSLNVSGVGQSTGAYDAGGRLVSERLPNGVRATTSYDESGAAVGLAYDDCSSTCRGLLSFSVTKSGHDQVVAETTNGPQGTRQQGFAYDSAGRLYGALDQSPNRCEQRDYRYDADSNRTLDQTFSYTDNACSQGRTETKKREYAHDDADRINNPGYQYDQLGRTLSVPASDAGGSDLSATYYANDLARTITQAGATTSLGLDPALRTRLRTKSGSPDEIQHFAGDTASPSWSVAPSSGHWTRLVPGISGLLAAEQKGNAGGPTGTTFTLRDLQGSVVGSVNAVGTPQLQVTDQFDEFGVPVDGSANKRYGWLGGNKVSTETATGVIAMGARLYVPSLGRFLQMDPVPGGSANPYDYANQDPLNQLDLDGLKARHHRANARPSLDDAVDAANWVKGKATKGVKWACGKAPGDPCGKAASAAKHAGKGAKWAFNHGVDIISKGIGWVKHAWDGASTVVKSCVVGVGIALIGEGIEALLGETDWGAVAAAATKGCLSTVVGVLGLD